MRALVETGHALDETGQKAPRALASNRKYSGSLPELHTVARFLHGKGGDRSPAIRLSR